MLLLLLHHYHLLHSSKRCWVGERHVLHVLLHGRLHWRGANGISTSTCWGGSRSSRWCTLIRRFLAGFLAFLLATAERKAPAGLFSNLLLAIQCLQILAARQKAPAWIGLAGPVPAKIAICVVPSLGIEDIEVAEKGVFLQRHLHSRLPR